MKVKLNQASFDRSQQYTYNGTMLSRVVDTLDVMNDLLYFSSSGLK